MAPSDDEAIFEQLQNDIDNDFDLAGIREKRLEELRAQMDAAQRIKESDYGKLTEFKVEKEVIDAMAKAPRAVLHFFHRDFRKCAIMDSHLEKLAPKHLDTLFLKAEVSNVPFLVTKLGVKVLPCVVGFVDGISKMKIIGFEDLQGGETGDNFETSSLELVMHQNGVISSLAGTKTPFGGQAQQKQRRPAKPGHAYGRRIRPGTRQDDSDSE